MEIMKLLSEEIQNELNELKRLEVGSEEYKTAVDGITKLTTQFNELDKARYEEIKGNARDWYERRDRWVSHGIAVAGIVLPLIVTVWGTKASFKFENEGTVTTIMGRGFINKLLPKK